MNPTDIAAVQDFFINLVVAEAIVVVIFFIIFLVVAVKWINRGNAERRSEEIARRARNDRRR